SRLMGVVSHPIGMPTQTTVSHDYGFDGLRRSTTNPGGVATPYTWSQGELVQEGDKFYEHGANGAVFQVAGERIAHDALGSNTGRDGATPTTHRYDAFGNYRET